MFSGLGLWVWLEFFICGLIKVTSVDSCKRGIIGDDMVVGCMVVNVFWGLVTRGCRKVVVFAVALMWWSG